MIPVPAERILAVFENGLESGAYRYWARVSLDGETVKVVEYTDENETTHTITRSDIVQRAAVMMTVAPRQLANIITEQDDIWTADALLQCVLFGEVRYG